MHIGLIIWGVEGTLFRASPDFALVESRAALIRAFNDYGIASTICAEADVNAFQPRLAAHGLWSEFVLPRFDSGDAEAVRQQIADFGMTPAQTILVDNDPARLDAARALMPDIRIVNAGADDGDATLEAMCVTHRRPWRTRTDIALLFGPRTRSIAQFSDLRARIDHDAPARAFSLSGMISGPMAQRGFARFVAYDAGMDYAAARWPDLADLLDCDGLYEACVHMMCEQAKVDGARLLVMLPSAGDAQIPTAQQRRRTIRFNALWRDVAALHDNVEVIDMPEASDKPSRQLRLVAGLVDEWVEGPQAAERVRAA